MAKSKKKISDMLMTNRYEGRLTKPSLNLHVSMESDMKYPGESGPSDYEKKEIKRLKSEIKAGEQAAKSWNNEEVGKKAYDTFMANIEVKRARLAECEARMKAQSIRGSSGARGVVDY